MLQVLLQFDVLLLELLDQLLELGVLDALYAAKLILQELYLLLGLCLPLSGLTVESAPLLGEGGLQLFIEAPNLGDLVLENLQLVLLLLFEAFDGVPELGDLLVLSVDQLV